MQNLSFVAALVVLAALAFVYFALSKKLGELRDLQRDGAGRGDEIRKAVNQDLSKMLEQISKVDQSIGELKPIRDKVDSINSLFFSQKLRGNFGELVLKDMLEKNFPRGAFEMQYRFKEGQIVDAVLKTKDGLVCIDSKFPAENYRKMVAAEKQGTETAAERNNFAKAVRKHVKDIADKYIRQGEGTADIAVMYVPSEVIFYEILTFTNDQGVDDDIVGFATANRVLITSPNTMSYFLYIMKVGQERTRIEENAQKAWSLISGLQQDFVKFGDTLRIAWKHVTDAKKSIDAVGNDFSHLSGKIEQVKKLED